MLLGTFPWVMTCREGEGAGWSTVGASSLPAPELAAWSQCDIGAW